MAVITGTDFKDLDRTLLEFFSPGQRVSLLLGLPRAVSESEMEAMAEHLMDSGVQLHSMEFGSTAEWPNALHLVFTRPPRASGYGVVWYIPIAIIGSLAVIGVGAWMGWKVGEAISVNIIPLTLILVGGIIIAAYAMRPAAVTLAERGPEYIREAKGAVALAAAAKRK